MLQKTTSIYTFVQKNKAPSNRCPYNKSYSVVIGRNRNNTAAMEGCRPP